MDTPFFDSLFDDFSIWQHSDGDAVIRTEGYALDDAARGLLVCLALNQRNQAEVLFNYLMASREGLGFNGFATEGRQFFRFPASDDATGQVIWAMGYAGSLDFHADEARQVIDQCRPTILAFEHVRGYAYALLGTVYSDHELAKQLYYKLMDFFKLSDENWLWPEPVMTYGNGIIPYALMRYGLICADDQAAEFGLKLCKFIQAKCEMNNRILGPIGNDGWLPKDAPVVPEYSQQPIDSAYMTMAWLAAYQRYSDQKYYDSAERWQGWFEGDNIKNEKMYNPLTMKCYDGIDEAGVHHHSGAESNICFILSRWLLQQKTTI